MDIGCIPWKGLKGDVHWSRADFTSIAPLKSYSLLDAFCDESGKINESLPRAKWNVQFTESGNSTLVTIDVKFEKPSDLEGTLDMGFKEGFIAAMENLDEIFNSK